MAPAERNRESSRSLEAVTPNTRVDLEALKREIDKGGIDALIADTAAHEKVGFSKKLRVLKDKIGDVAEATGLLGPKFVANYNVPALSGWAGRLGIKDIFSKIKEANQNPAMASNAIKALLLASKKELNTPLDSLAAAKGAWQKPAQLAVAIQQGRDPREVLA